MYEMLKALDHMHRNGIFHRDVKPLNDEVSLQKAKKVNSKGSFKAMIAIMKSLKND